MEKQRIPIGAKKLLVKIFFDNLGEAERINSYLNLLKNRGYDIDEFYWASPELQPSAKDLEEILSDGYGLYRGELQDYLKKYEEYLKTER